MKDLYVHYENVTNNVTTRGIDLIADDFSADFFPKNMILSEEPVDFGRFDAQTNFKVLRGQQEVRHYMQTVQKEKLRISNWTDFESIESMHSLEPSEIAELLYLFHSSRTIRSAFFYKLQNNFVFLTLPNGLNKTYYRHIQHFYPRFSRVMTRAMEAVINDTRGFFARKVKLKKMPETMSTDLLDDFKNGVKINLSQSYVADSIYYVPLDIIEDDLTKLTINQRPKEHFALICYNEQTAEWHLERIEQQ